MLVLKVTIPGRSTPVIVSIGLDGNGIVARTILYSLRQASSSASGPGQFSASAGSINFIGNWSVTSLVFPTREDGFAFVSGTSKDGRSSALLERTTNGGRTWLAMREPPTPMGLTINPPNLAFNSANDGWWYGGTVLRRTIDGGLNWQEIPTNGNVLSLVTWGPRTWIVESVGPISRGRCRSEILSSTEPNDLPTPLKNQPPLGTSCNWQLLPVSASTVYFSEAQNPAFQATAPPAASYYWALTDSGESWVKRTTPCAGTKRWGPFSFTGTKVALWLLCPTGPFDSMPDLLPVRLYVSSDNGGSWKFERKGWFQLGQIVVLGKQQAWFWSQWRGANPGTVGQTTDAGLKWSDAFAYRNGSIATPFFGRFDFALPEAMVANGAWAALAVCTVQASTDGNLNHLVVGITENDGKSWRWSYLLNLLSPNDTAKSLQLKRR